MAPRKTLKPTSDPKPEVTGAPKAPARPRTKKAPIDAPVPSVPAPAAPEVAAQTPTVPAKAAKPARTPRAARPKAPLPGSGLPGSGLPGSGLPESGSLDPAPAAEPAAPVAAMPQAAAQPAVDPATLVTDQARAVLSAIQEGRAVELIFADGDSNPPRTFEPRQLIFDTFAKGWYVWGWDRRYNAERHHLLDLIAQVNPVEGLGRAAQGPYKEGTPANLIGGWLGGEPIRVKAVLLKQWIFAVRQAPAPFPEFRIEDLEEGKAQVTFTATDLRAITRWVMQFGDGVQILEPMRLLDRIKQVGLTWSGKSAPTPAPKPAAQREPRETREPREARETREPREAREPREPREHRSEHKSEHRPEPRSEAKSESAPERRTPESRHPRESHDSPKPAKPGKIEIRIDRL